MNAGLVDSRAALAIGSVQRRPGGGQGGVRVRVLTMVLLGSLLIATAAAAAQAPQTSLTPKTPVTGGARYLALGDSVVFGFQEAQVVPAPNYSHPTSFHGYPELLGAELHLRVINASCPGETSASLINASAPSNGCENAYRKAFPLHRHYSGSQLSYAIAFLRSHGGVRLVSLMVGANDLFLCQKTTKDGCTGASEQRAVFAEIARNVRQILSSIRNRAHYHGQLAIVNYYSLNYASAFLTNASLGLNKAMDGVAKRFHAEIADGFGELETAARHSGGDPCAAGLLTQLGKPGHCGVHPSYAGQGLLALALLKAIQL